ncbi:hypothetical protein DMP15_05675 [Pseudonocardia sp. UM4_GMWB1]
MGTSTRPGPDAASRFRFRFRRNGIAGPRRPAGGAGSRRVVPGGRSVRGESRRRVPPNVANRTPARLPWRS